MSTDDCCMLAAGSLVLGLTALLLSWATQPPPRFMGYDCKDAYGPQRAQERDELSHCRLVQPVSRELK